MKPGNISNPFTVAPDDWYENGLPYGAYCECAKCGLVERSIISFDYYAKRAGDPLVCETCTVGTPHALIAPIIQEVETNEDTLP